MNYRQHGPGSFGGLGFDPDQIFGPQGLLSQVFGNPQGGTPPWGSARPSRPPYRSQGPGRGPGRRARRGDVRNAILHLLQREPMNGYQLMQEIAQSSGGAWQPSSGAIYPALSLLEDEGLVEQHELEGRKAYQLTDAGRRAAEDLPRQTWMAGGQEPDDPWEEDPGRGRRGGRYQGWAGPSGSGRGPDGGRRRERGAQLWKALGTVAMATQAVGQAGEPQLSQEAADLLDRTRRDLYRLLAEAEVARDDEARDADDDLDGADDGGDEEIADGEIVED